MSRVRKSLRKVGKALESVLVDSRPSFVDERRRERWFIELK